MQQRLDAIRYNVGLYRRREDLTRAREVEGNPDLSSEARRRLMAELHAGLNEAFFEMKAKNDTLVEGARREFIATLPYQKQVNAAFDEPDRAREVEGIAAKLEPSMVATFVEKAAERGDLAAAFGLRTVVQRIEDGAQERALMERLDTVGAGDFDTRVALLLAIQYVAADFESAGPLQAPDPVLGDSVRTMSLFRAARSIPAGIAGELRDVPEEEARVALASVLGDSLLN